jgi:SSS family solute:Na+ symporter
MLIYLGDEKMLNQIQLTVIDHVIIGLYFILVAIIGYYAAKQTHNEQDFFLAGRRLHWLPIGFSLFASNISSTTLIGLAGAAYTWGLAVANYEWMAAPILVIMAVVFIPLYLGQRIGTVPEWLEHRFDQRIRRYFSVLTIIANIVVDTAGTLFAGALVLTTLIPELNLLTAALLLAVVAASYTAIGGLAAVVYTDVVQAIILLIGSFLITWYSFAYFNFDWTAFVAMTPPEQLSLLLPLDNPHLPWLGTLIGVPILGFYFWCTNQFIVQRVLGARSIAHARYGVLFAGLLKLSVLFIMVLPGVMAIQIVPELTYSDQVFPALIIKLLPAGLTGLILAALVAALMSSIDSTLNSAATLLTLDFIKPAAKQLNTRTITGIGRIAIMLFMIIAALIAPLISHFPGLFNYLQTALSYLVPPVAAVFLFGAFVKRAGGRSALITLIGGHSLSVVLFMLSLLDLMPIHFTLIAGILFIASAALFMITTWLWPLPAEQTPQALWHPALAQPETPQAWWSDYRVHSGLLISLTIWLIWNFR